MSPADPRQDGATSDDSEHWVAVLRGSRPASTPEEARLASLRTALAIIPADTPSEALTPQQRTALLAALEETRAVPLRQAVAMAPKSPPPTQDDLRDPLAVIRWNWRWLLGGRAGAAAWRAAAVAAVLVVMALLVLLRNEGDLRGPAWAESPDPGTATARLPADPRNAPVTAPPVSGPNVQPPDGSSTVVVAAASPEALAARLWSRLADAQLNPTVERVEAQIVVTASVPTAQQAVAQQILLDEGIRWSLQTTLRVAVRPTSPSTER